MLCSGCDWLISESANFCSQCGKAVEAKITSLGPASVGSIASPAVSTNTDCDLTRNTSVQETSLVVVEDLLYEKENHIKFLENQLQQAKEALTQARGYESEETKYLKECLQEKDRNIRDIEECASQMIQKITEKYQEAREKDCSSFIKDIYSMRWNELPDFFENILKTDIFTNVRFCQAADGEAPLPQSVISKVNNRKLSSGCVLCTLALMIASKGPTNATFSCEDAASLVANVTVQHKKHYPNTELPCTKDEVMRHFLPPEYHRPRVEDFMAPLLHTGIIKPSQIAFLRGDDVTNLYQLNRNIKEIAHCNDLFVKDKLLMCGCEYTGRQGHMFAVARIRSKPGWMLYPIDGQNRDGKCSPHNFVGLSQLYFFCMTDKGRDLALNYWRQYQIF